MERVKQAEGCEWMQMLRQFRSKVDQDRSRGDTPAPLVWRPDQQQYNRSMQKKAIDGGIRRAKSALEAGPEVANDGATLEGLRKLVAVEVDEEERQRQKEDLKVASKATRATRQAGDRVIGATRTSVWSRLSRVAWKHSKSGANYGRTARSLK